MGNTLSTPQGAIAGRYLIERELGRGGMATVFLARDLTHERHVALKLLNPELAGSVSNERFLREIRLTAQLHHPHILPLYDSGVFEGVPFYVMPHVKGESLRQRLTREKQLAVPEALRIARHVASALAYAHAHGIVHRDIKPENILLSGDDVYLADLGIARAIDQAAADHMTSTGLALGTPAYMSPEQASGDQAVDGRSDLYSLACVLYEMLAGIPPFVGATPQAVIARRFAAPAPPLREARESVPEHVDRAVARALERVPADRLASVEEFAAALESAESTPTISQPPVRRARYTFRRPLWLVAALCVFGLGVALASRGALGGRQRMASPDPRRIAVLHFKALSADSSLGYLASGLTRSLIHELSSVEAIRVVSPSGVKPYPENSLLDSLAATMRVGSVVEGSLQRKGDSVQVIAQLIDARTGTYLESVSFEHSIGELPSLEDDLAHMMAAKLRRRIGTEVRLREAGLGTTSARARDLVIRAERTRDDAAAVTAGPDSLDVISAVALLRSADSLVGEARRADPVWIRPLITGGWVQLDIAGLQSGSSRSAALHRALMYAESAVGRAPRNAQALELRGTVLLRQVLRSLGSDTVGQLLDRAEQDLRSAVALDPTLASAWGRLSLVPLARGNFMEAEINAERALAMDAYLADAPEIFFRLFSSATMLPDLPKAKKWCERGGRDYPGDWRFLDCRLTLLREDPSALPDSRTAWSLVAQLDRVDPPPKARAAGRAYLPIYRRMVAAAISARAGDRRRARAVAAWARRETKDDPELSVDLDYDEAYLRLVLGERTEAFRLLSHYLAARPIFKSLVARDNLFKDMRSEPAFALLVQR